MLTFNTYTASTSDHRLDHSWCVGPVPCTSTSALDCHIFCGLALLHHHPGSSSAPQCSCWCNGGSRRLQPETSKHSLKPICFYQLVSISIIRGSCLTCCWPEDSQTVLDHVPLYLCCVLCLNLDPVPPNCVNKQDSNWLMNTGTAGAIMKPSNMKRTCIHLGLDFPSEEWTKGRVPEETSY